jgi:hypothetical protein
MPRPQIIRTLRTISFTLVAAVGLGITGMSAVAASPEDEIARLNRVRANLFEELVRTRAEAASARAELEAAIKARDAAEAELARLKAEASAQPANSGPSAETETEPQHHATNAAAPAIRHQSVRPAAPGATGSVHRAAAASTQQRVVRTRLAPSAGVRQINQGVRQASAPIARAQELPSVLRLQDPR